MNIKECIDTVDNLKPNQYTIKEKVMWLSFIEEIIINDVLKTHEGYDGRYDDFEGYSEDKISVTLIVPSPYDRLYTAYLTMKIDESNGETTRYNNSATLYNSYMMEYKKYYNKTHMPIDVIGGKRHMKPQHKPSVSLSDAEYDNIVKDLTFKLTEYFSNTISPDKLYDIVMKYVQNNVEMLKGKDGRDGVDGKDGHTPAVGVDYFTENDKMEFLNHLQEYISSLALSEGDVTTKKIDDRAVTTAKIADGAITRDKIEDGAVTEEKLADGAVTGDKIDDKAVLSQHLSVEVVERIDSNKFDGVIHYSELYDFDKLPVYDNYPLVYKIHDTDMFGENGGLLIVSGLFGKAYDLETGKEEPVLVTIYQIKIDIHYGTIERRYSLSVEGNRATAWSEWKSAYADLDDAITKKDFATKSPGTGQYGEPGIIRLGHQQGLTMSNENTLMVEAASAYHVKQKYSSHMPIPPALMAYAVALATHQQIGDDYNIDEFAVVNASKQNNESYYFPLSKDSLPVSYKAVKEAISNIDTSIYESFNVVEIHGIGSRAGDGLNIMVHPDGVEKFTSTEYVYLLNDGVYHKLKTSDFICCGVIGDGENTSIDDHNAQYNGWTYYWYNNADFNCNENTGFSLPLYYGIGLEDLYQMIKATPAVPHMYLTSPDNSIYKVTVNNNGDLETAKVTFDENGNETIVPPDIEFE